MIRKANGQNLRITANNTIGTAFACATETVLGSVTLPADFLSSGASIILKSFCLKSGTANAFTLKLYFNTTATTVGAVQLGTYSVVAANVTPGIYRKFFFDSATTARGLSGTFSASNDIGDIASSVVQFSFTNWLVGGGVFFLTGLRTSGTETLQLYQLHLET